MLSVAEKVRVHRARKAAGEIVLQIVVSETLADWLVDARLLAPHQADDREAIAHATQRMVQFFTEEKSG